MAFIARSLRKGPHTWAARGAWEPRDCPESLSGTAFITSRRSEHGPRVHAHSLHYAMTFTHGSLDGSNMFTTPVLHQGRCWTFTTRGRMCVSPCTVYHVGRGLYTMYTMCRRGLWYTRYTTGTRAHTAQGSGTAYPGSTPCLKPTAWSLRLAQHRTSRSSLTQTLTSRRPGGAAAPDEEARGPGPAWPSPCASAPAARADRSARHRW